MAKISNIILVFFIFLFSFVNLDLCWSESNPELDKIRQSANNGDLQAQYLLGSLYYYGDVVKIVDDIDYKGEPLKKDLKEASRWFRNPAEHGHIYSQYCLGEIYNQQFQWGGVFEEKPFIKEYGEEAVRWYQKAAIQGHRPSQDRMRYLMTTWEVEMKPRENVQDTNFNDLLQSAEQGDIEAQYQVGYRYAEGKGIPPNIQEAGKWFYKSALKGHPKAQHNIGLLYYKRQEPYKAIEWFSKASTQGDKDSSYMMGMIYMEGIGVPKDPERGHKFMLKAGLQGHPKGQRYVGYCYATGSCSSIPKNLTKAKEWFSKAVNQGDKKAMAYLTFVEFEQTVAESSFKRSRPRFSYSGKEMEDVWATAAAIAGTLWFVSEIGNAKNDQSKSDYSYEKPSEGCTSEYINRRLMYCYNESVEGIDAECGASLLDDDVAACESAVQWEMDHGVPDSYWWCDKKTHFVSPDKSRVIEKICQ